MESTNNTSRRRMKHVALASLCLLSLPSGNRAFSTPRRTCHSGCTTPFETGLYHKRRRANNNINNNNNNNNIPRTITFSSAIDIESVTPEPSSDPLSIQAIQSVETTTNNNDLVTTLTASSTTNLQSRTLDPNAIINTSILLAAILTVLYQVLSIDIGITRGWSPEEIAYRIPLDNWRSYTHILNMAPLPTKAITSATVYTIGDIIAQSKEGAEIGKLDRWRIGRSLIAGLIGHGPMSHVWYHVSEDFFDTTLHLHAWWDFIPKVVVDQTVFGPIWNNSYILLLGLMQFQKPMQIWETMRSTTIPLIVSGLKLWPFVHCITYGLIPVENRLLWVDAVEIVWVTILASQAAGKGEEVDGSSSEGGGGLEVVVNDVRLDGAEEVVVSGAVKA